MLCFCCIGLFIDVGTNYSVLDHTNLSFIYEDVLSPGPNSDGEFVRQLFDAFVFCAHELLLRRFNMSPFAGFMPRNDRRLILETFVLLLQFAVF